MFTWEVNSAVVSNRELDFEFAQWGNAADPTRAQYVIQPYGTPGHLQRYAMSSGGPVTCVMTWTSAAVCDCLFVTAVCVSMLC